MTVAEMGLLAVNCKSALASASAETKNAALLRAADMLNESSEVIIAANRADMSSARLAGMSPSLLDRLMLDEKRVAGICDSIREIAAFPDPVGRTLSRFTNEDGLDIEKITVPIGVIGVIFEARPNVSADSAALCLKSGNAVILRGGKEALRSNEAITDVFRRAAEAVGLPADCVQLVRDTSRESAHEMMELSGSIDLLIPRGGRGLIEAVVADSKIPTIHTGAGVCHVYVDADADPDMAAEIICNAKVSRPSVCNACECMLIHEAIAPRALPKIAELLRAESVEIRGDAATRMYLPDAVEAFPGDFGCEFGDLTIASKIVPDIDAAIAHIARFGTRHSEAIVTDSEAAAEYFLKNVDSAAVYVNASTRFTDGNVFGMGAEIGISTQKLHARGPVGLNELTSYKYVIRGKGQIRV